MAIYNKVVKIFIKYGFLIFHICNKNYATYDIVDTEKIAL